MKSVTRIMAPLLTAFLLSAGAALAQTTVLFTGTIASLDSTRANMTIRTAGGNRFVVIPTNVDVRRVDSDGPRLGVEDLTRGTEVLVEAVKSVEGVTAKRIVVARGPGSPVPPALPPAANQVTVTPSYRQPRGFQVRTHGGAATGVENPLRTRSALIADDFAEIILDDRAVFRFPGTRAYDPNRRAEIVASRLNRIYGDPDVRPSSVRVVRLGNEWAVMAGNRLIVTADRWAAQASNTTPRQLANRWAANLRSALQQ